MEDYQVAPVLNDVALLYYAQGRYQKGESSFKRLRKILEEHAAGSAEMAICLENYAAVLRRLDRDEESTQLAGSRQRDSRGSIADHCHVLVQVNGSTVNRFNPAASGLPACRSNWADTFFCCKGRQRLAGAGRPSAPESPEPHIDPFGRRPSFRSRRRSEDPERCLANVIATRRSIESGSPLRKS